MDKDENKLILPKQRLRLGGISEDGDVVFLSGHFIALYDLEEWLAVMRKPVKADGYFKGGEGTEFLNELTAVVNKHSKENGSDTPDFILAAYLGECLAAYDRGVNLREKWYGREGK